MVLAKQVKMHIVRFAFKEKLWEKEHAALKAYVVNVISIKVLCVLQTKTS